MSERIPLAALNPPRGDRVVFVGQTGSGKTTLAEVLLRSRAYVVVLDSKGMVNWPGYHVHTTLRRVLADEHARLIYRPSYDELANGTKVEQFFEWVYRRGHTTVYVDELAAITRGDQFPYHLGACLTRGRELGVESWNGTQRPMRIPQVVLSESEHVFCFRLRMPQDRDRVEQVAGVESERITALAKRDFLYSAQDADTQGPFRLALP